MAEVATEQNLEYAQRACIHLKAWAEKQPDRSSEADLMAGLLWLSTGLASSITFGIFPLSSIDKFAALLRVMTMDMLEEAASVMSKPEA